MAGTQLQVLVVDANPAEISMLSEALTRDRLASFAMTTSARLDAALGLLHERAFDAIVLDLDLPDGRGPVALAHVQQAGPGTPVVILVRPADEALGLQAVAAGAQDYLVKGPSGWDAAACAIRNAIVRQRVLRASEEKYRIPLDITGRRQAEEELRVSQERYRSLVENMSDVVMEVDAQGNYRYISPNYAPLTGYALEDESGGPVLTHIHPHDRPLVLQGIAKVLAGERQSATYRVQKKDGEWRWLETRGTLYHTAAGEPRIIAVARDVTERKLAEEALRQSEQKYRTLHESMIDGLAQSSMDGRLIAWNEAFRAMLGYAGDELATLTYIDITPQKWHAYEAEIVANQIAKRGYSDFFEKEYRRKDGTTIPVELRIVLLYDEAGHPVSSWAIVRDITERKQAEQALRASERKYRELLESIDNGVSIVDYEGRFLYMNDQGAEQLGSTPDKLIGRSMLELFPEPMAVRQLARIQQIIRDDREMVVETQSLGTGGLRWYRISIQPMHDAAGRAVQALINTNDIHDLKTAQQELLALNQTLEQRIAQRTAEVQDLYDNAPTGYHSLDADGTFIMMNQTELDWLGYTRAEVLGVKTFRDLLSPPSQLVFGANFRHFKACGRLKDLELEFVRKDGSLLPVLLNATAIYDAAGRFSHSRSTILDITAEKQAAETLRRANRELERAMRMKDEFLANMSHELRSPLNAILTLGEILLEQIHGSLNERQQAALRDIEAGGRHLLDLINDILDLSKIEAGRLDLRAEVVAVAGICQASLLFVKELAAKKPLKLAFRLNDSEARLDADPKRLKQMLVNLLTNAVKFTPAGGLVSLEVDADVAAGIVRFTVADTGIGMAEEDLLRLFRPFVQLDASLSREHEGTGLGLALVSRLAELQGGSVSVESRVGQGSRFTITLPYRPLQPATAGELPAPADETPAAGALPPAPAAADTRRAGTRILLAEDNEVSALAVSIYLRSHGYQVELALDGREALDLAARIRPDLILMDIQMPRMDGLEATRRLRAMPDFADTPIIALTALAMPGDRERCLAVGASEYLSKPCSLTGLLAHIRRMLTK
jgi:PAS domain S-box-containing protein